MKRKRLMLSLGVFLYLFISSPPFFSVMDTCICKAHNKCQPETAHPSYSLFYYSETHLYSGSACTYSLFASYGLIKKHWTADIMDTTTIQESKKRLMGNDVEDEKKEGSQKPNSGPFKLFLPTKKDCV